MIKRQNKGHEGKRWQDFQLLIPLDLIVEILKKLPSKSLMRFRCVSKQWSTIITTRRDFVESIVTRSLSQPPQKLPVFIFHHCEIPRAFFTVSSSFSQSTRVTVPGLSNFTTYQYVRGLICVRSSWQSRLVTIYNPTTRQVLCLPEIPSPMRLCLRCAYFGYDPVMNEYKVLSMIFDPLELKQTVHVFTLGSPIRMQSWRQIQGSIDDEEFHPGGRGVCIDGTIYYRATRKVDDEPVLLSFDVRSERFGLVRIPEALFYNKTLVNYLGKLGWVGCNQDDTSMWVMENAEKKEWSRINLEYPLNCLEGDFNSFSVSGVTRAGEIIMVPACYNFTKSLYTYYYDIRQNSFRRVEIQGTRPDGYFCDIFAIPDHVENTMWL